MINKYIQIKYLLSKKNKIYLVILFLLFFISSFLEILSLGSIPIVVSIIANPGSLEKFNLSIIYWLRTNYSLSDQQLNLWILVATLIIFFFRSFILSFIIYFHGLTIKLLKEHLSIQFLKSYINSDYIFFLSRSSAKIIKLQMVDVGNTCILIYHLINFFKEIIIIISVVLFSCYLTGITTFIFFILIASIVTLYYLINRKSLIKRSKSIFQYSEDIIKNLNNSIGLIKEIKFTSSESLIVQDFNKKIKFNESLILKNNLINSLPRFIIEFTFIAFLLLALIYLVITNYEIYTVLPLIVLVCISAIRLIPSFTMISLSFNLIKQLSPYLDSVYQEIYNNRNNSNFLEKIDSFAKLFDFKKEIYLNNINFVYPDGKKIFQNFSFKFICGKTYGIYGKSGSGKTTLLELVLGLLKPSQGSITIDNLNIENIKKSWQKNIGYISQDVYILNETLKKNILFSFEEQNFDEIKINKIFENLNLLEFLNSLPFKYNSIIGENGRNISLGQKQRIGIARVLYKEPQVLILDEATNAIDKQSEKNFFSYLFKAYKDKTIIIVSHDYNNLLNCDYIYDFDKKEFVKY
jgi:ATP-binding cassette subfamily C protein